MLELIKNSLLTGLGLALKTWDEVEAMAKEIEKKGEMPRDEAKKFLADVRKNYEEAQSDLEKRVEQSVRSFLKKADVVTGEDLKALKKEIRDLKKLVSDENASSQKASS